jgi:hypothetical protein
MKKWIIIFLSFLLSGCSGIPQILKSSQCTAPCWREINMGDSKETTITKIENMSDINTKSIEYGTSNREYLEEYVSWSFNNNKDIGTFGFHNSKVSYFSLESKSRPSLGEIVKQLGNPDKLILTKSRLDGVYITARFVYNKGISILVEKSLLPFNNPDHQTISPNLEVSVIYFYDQQLIGINKYILITVLDIYSPESAVYDWKGFGDYKFLDDYGIIK